MVSSAIHILGTDFNFDLEVRVGAGAFVCGEETALMASIMGQRGEPRPRPPFPSVKGVWGKPSNNNNVETYANVPQIILIGADWYACMGTERSKGTKTFAVGGNVAKPGLIEVPMGITLREIIFDVAGGIKDGKKYKAVQTGGPMGGCLTEEHLDLPLDYEALTQAGSMMGSAEGTRGRECEAEQAAEADLDGVALNDHASANVWSAPLLKGQTSFGDRRSR